jgi:hypothetical protein
MTRKAALTLSVALLFVSGCSGGEMSRRLGFVVFDENHRVSAAEPLFGKDEDLCLDSPTFLMSIYNKNFDLVPTAGANDLVSTGREGRNNTRARKAAGSAGSMSTAYETACRQVIATIRAALQIGSFGDAPAATDPLRLSTPYTDRQRNEAVDALIAASNRKCGRYIAFLQQYDANINSTLGIAAQASAIIASVASGGTAQGFAAASGIAGGARGSLNNAHFQNQTIAVLTNAFENSRAQQRLEISRRQQCTPARYTLMRGLEDAFRYHSSCSIVFGLKQAQRAVEEANSPNLESFNKMLDQLAEAQSKVAKLNGKSEASGTGTETGGAADGAAAPAPQTSTTGNGTGSTSGNTTGNGTGSTSAPATTAQSASQGITDAPGGTGGQAAANGCPFDPPRAATAANSPKAKPAPKRTAKRAPARKKRRA